ncbi:HAD family hydrolase [Paenibacillus roseipurpureus]|uniref:HAD family phosphatase n=1 Tax=Paenibacillus roseopurpureus TaxID=2918901 RepID=A0AA96LPY1_9BACL|nr:HAD family phosphatase [Paenibacillus sp. MBLB1832]WNR43663.1 HAD family phosphatase [Paenibacillus sp. MBLB1832]
MFSTFIFDMDGVIIDSEPLHFKVDEYVMNTFGIDITQKELEEFVGMTNPEMWSKLIAKYSLSQTVEEIINLQLNTKLELLKQSNEQPIEGVKELIVTLKQNQIRIGLASSSPRIFIEAVLKKFDIRHNFSDIISGEEVLKGKPAPDIYLRIAKLFGVRVEECIVLEDSKNGIVAAKAAGMKCIGYKNLNSGNQDLSAADYIVNRIKEINYGTLKSL